MRRTSRLLALLLLGLLPACLGVDPGDEQGAPAPSCTSDICWAFSEGFDGRPDAPSQDLLPRTFDYAVTHRSHPAEHFRDFGPFPADHGADCAPPGAQHPVVSRHDSHGGDPDASFYLCADHMMSSLGDVEGYSVSAFWPRQAFDFAGGGVLEFDVNLNDGHPRHWFEVMIAPAEQLKVGAAASYLPIDETYPEDRIVLAWGLLGGDSSRAIRVGTGALDPDGWTVDAHDWRSWRDIDPDDPALEDRRIRRTMRVALGATRVVWEVEMQDGSFDAFAVDLPDGLPFSRGLVVFKTHAYTPEKDGNTELYTFHWDDIRFSGPLVGRYRAFAAEAPIYLQANGSRAVGDSAETVVALPEVGAEPVLFGQLHNPLRGQVLLSVNGRDPVAVEPLAYADGGCHASGWSSFRLPLEPAWLVAGENRLRWSIGPRPDCVADWVWDGFSVKHLQIQLPQP